LTYVAHLVHASGGAASAPRDMLTSHAARWFLTGYLSHEGSLATSRIKSAPTS